MAGGRLIMLCGLPGAGKTTLARRLAGELAAIRFCPDEWLTDLGIDLFDVHARDRVERKLWQLTQDLLRRGHTVILEYGFWSRSEREDKRRFARAIGAAVELRFLDVPFEELVRRVEARNTSGGPGTVSLTRELLAEYRPLFQAPDACELGRYDDAVPNARELARYDGAASDVRELARKEDTAPDGCELARCDDGVPDAGELAR
jgi:predicted kinase